MRFALFITVVSLTVTMVTERRVPATELHERTAIRRPVALVLGNEHLLVANKRSGTVSIIDTASQRVSKEVLIGQTISDLKRIPGTEFLLATDEESHRLLLVKQTPQATANNTTLQVAQRISVPHTPVNICVSPNHDACSVSSLWARQISIFSLSSNETDALNITMQSTIDLPFAPRHQWWSPDGTRLLVADTFQGRIGAVDVVGNKLLGIARIEGHNIRGFTSTSDGKRLLVTHQLINRHVPTTRSRVFWGALMSNLVRSIELEHIWKQTSDSYQEQDISRWEVYPLGEPTDAAGDPGQVLHFDDTTIALIGGTDQVAIRKGQRQLFHRIRVGRRPIAIALSQDKQIAYVANHFDDSVSIIGIDDANVIKNISLGEMDSLTLTDRGEMLFYDASLSLDNWYSCHSCHTDGHTSGEKNDNLGDSSFGAPKRILSLLGVRDTGPWAWDGHQKNLTDQIRKSIAVTMQGAEQKRDTEENATALAAFLYSLDAPPSLSAARRVSDESAIARGQKLFRSNGCVNCHHEGTWTSPDVYDVGLKDEVGNTHFNPPSLRGVSQRGRLFHDARADLEGVLGNSAHSADFDLKPDEIHDLISFLRSL